MAKNNIIYMPCQTAILSALENLGYSENVMQTMESALVRWSAEAEDLIDKRPGAYPKLIDTRLTLNNQIRNTPDFLTLESLKIGDRFVEYDRNIRSTPHVRMGIENNWGYNGNYYEGLKYQLTKEFITFTPNIADNTPVTIEYLVRPSDDDGYPMIRNLCERADSYYIGWKLCIRERDDRAQDQYAQWLKSCKQSRADLNAFTNEEIMNIGKAYMGVRNRRRWYGNFYW